MESPSYSEEINLIPSDCVASNPDDEINSSNSNIESNLTSLFCPTNLQSIVCDTILLIYLALSFYFQKIFST